MLISIVVPVYNEEDNINVFYNAVNHTMSILNYDYEVIFVDDGSRDKSAYILNDLTKFPIITLLTQLYIYHVNSLPFFEKNVNTFYHFLSFSFKNSKSVQKKSRKELILLSEFFSHPHISSLKSLSNKMSKHPLYLRYVLIIF